MSKLHWKPGTMLYPVPPVMVTCGDMEKPNIITVAWAGTVCTNPAMVSISVRKERFSYKLIVDRGEFVINLTTKPLVKAADYCGVKSGRDVNKFEIMHLTAEPSVHIGVPLIKESPLNIECRVKEVIELGSHDMIIGEVLGVNVDEGLLNAGGKLELEKSELITYSHGAYYEVGNLLGTFGYSIKKQNTKTRATGSSKSKTTDPSKFQKPTSSKSKTKKTRQNKQTSKASKRK